MGNRIDNAHKKIKYLIFSFMDFSDDVEECGDYERNEWKLNYFSFKSNSVEKIVKVRQLCKLSPLNFSEYFEKNEKEKVKKMCFLLNDVLEWSSPLITGKEPYGVVRTLIKTVHEDFFFTWKK